MQLGGLLLMLLTTSLPCGTKQHSLTGSLTCSDDIFYNGSVARLRNLVHSILQRNGLLLIPITVLSGPGPLIYRLPLFSRNIAEYSVKRQVHTTSINDRYDQSECPYYITYFCPLWCTHPSWQPVSPQGIMCLGRVLFHGGVGRSSHHTASVQQGQLPPPCHTYLPGLTRLSRTLVKWSATCFTSSVPGSTYVSIRSGQVDIAMVSMGNIYHTSLKHFSL